MVVTIRPYEGFPLIKLAKKLKDPLERSLSMAMFPLIKLAKKLKDFAWLDLFGYQRWFPLIKLAKKLKALYADIAIGVAKNVSIN